MFPITRALKFPGSTGVLLTFPLVSAPVFDLLPRTAVIVSGEARLAAPIRQRLVFWIPRERAIGMGKLISCFINSVCNVVFTF